MLVAFDGSLSDGSLVHLSSVSWEGDLGGISPLVCLYSLPYMLVSEGSLADTGYYTGGLFVALNFFLECFPSSS